MFMFKFDNLNFYWFISKIFKLKKYSKDVKFENHFVTLKINPNHTHPLLKIKLINSLLSEKLSDMLRNCNE